MLRLIRMLWALQEPAEPLLLDRACVCWLVS
jgi:hypothetical protein